MSMLYIYYLWVIMNASKNDNNILWLSTKIINLVNTLQIRIDQLDEEMLLQKCKKNNPITNRSFRLQVEKKLNTSKNFKDVPRILIVNPRVKSVTTIFKNIINNLFKTLINVDLEWPCRNFTRCWQCILCVQRLVIFVKFQHIAAGILQTWSLKK